MRRLFTLLYIIVAISWATCAQERRPQHKPYIDLRPLHFGISVGFHMQDIEFVNVGPQVVTNSDGTTVEQAIVCDQDNWNPGFSVGVLADHPLLTTQDLKNVYISLPIDLKFSAERFNNYRPYIIGGINPMINLSGKDQDYIQLKRYDTMVEIGLGCDFYLPFFKLIPELKFCYSLTDAINYKHIDELTDVNKRSYAQAVTPGHSKMIVLTFYFE